MLEKIFGNYEKTRVSIVAKFKVTILDNVTGDAVAEIVEGYTFPTVNYPQHMLPSSGRYGIPVKIELILEADEQNTTSFPT